MLEVGRVPLLSRAEERELAETLRDTGDVEAAKRLVAANLRFVVKIAFEYKNYNIRITDLVQEGNVGLMHAVSKFDPERGYRLISYAVWWIKAYIQNYIIKNWSLVPISARRKLLFRKRASLPGGESVGDKKDGEAESHYLIAAEPGKKPSLRDAQRELQLAMRDFSLDQTIGDDSGAQTTHLMRLESKAPSAEEEMGRTEVRQEVHRAIARVIDQIDERGQYILTNRLISEDPMSLAAIGEHFGVSRERARQLEKRVKEKLKRALSHLGEAEIAS